MKKTLVIAVLLLITAGLILYFIKPQAVTVRPETMIPGNALFAVEVDDLETAIENFKKTPLARQMRSIDVPAVLEKLEVPASDIDTYKNSAGEFLSTIDSPIFKNFFGKKAVIAMMPFEAPVSIPELEEAIPGNIVMFLEPKQNVELIKFLGPLFNDRLNAEEEIVDGIKMTRVELNPDITLYYTVKDGLLVVAFDKMMITRCLALENKPESTLSENIHYKDLNNRMKKENRRMFAFFNTHEFYNTVMMEARQFITDKEGLAEVEFSLGSLKAAKAMGISGWGQPDSWQSTVCMLLDRENLNPLYAEIYNIKPEVNNTLSMIPEDVLMYYWANTFEPKSYLDVYKAEGILDDDVLDAVENRMISGAGLTIEDTINAFGSQFGMSLMDIQIGGLFPLPKLVLFAEVKNRETVTRIINAALKESNLSLQEEINGEVKINYMMIPLGADLQPSYAFVDDFVLISSSRQTIKDMLALKQSGEGMIACQNYKAVTRGFKDIDNGIVYSRPDLFAEKIKAVSDWGADMMMFQDPDAAKKVRILVDNVVKPLMDGLKMFKAASSQTLIAEDVVTVDNVCTIDMNI
ncbi:MAG: hypothetical protein K9L30_03880 [Desulfobacterales bacterium]|nr:hypothetical protein [Desulfobacterales bacterium]